MISYQISNKFVIQGDSGGPLVLNGVVYGVTSFGVQECAVDSKDGIQISLKFVIRLTKYSVL